jgi:hypothetical protein
MKYLRWISAALAVSLWLGGQAKADYSYSTSTTSNPANGQYGATPSFVTFGAGTGNNLTGNNPIVIASVHNTGSAADSGTVTISDTITIMQPSGGPGMTTLTVNGTITFNANLPSTFTFNPVGSVLSGMIGSTTYSIFPNFYPYTPPTIGGTDGSLGVFLQVSAVPEPASMALVGVGGLLLAAPRLRRLVRRIAS